MEQASHTFGDLSVGGLGYTPTNAHPHKYHLDTVPPDSCLLLVCTPPALHQDNKIAPPARCVVSCHWGMHTLQLLNLSFGRIYWEKSNFLT